MVGLVNESLAAWLQGPSLSVVSLSEPEGDHDLRRDGVHVDGKLTELRERLLVQRREGNSVDEG